ncbi:alpha/beta hydrolase [uncultured Apibacter sp.]|uniref:alpha/beta fold hydrolase n=1 Tax=uncultured Apibacter sp. TaxID=1778616 RepID=UPI0025D45E08|nr:alpha/beta hydrolase [uncultured Apibacter sp.]
MPIVQINNRKTHILELNQEASETIVMVHGMFTNLSIFYFNIAPELAKKYRVVMYDLRSHGLSGKMDMGYDLETLSQDLLELLDYLNLSKVDLVGYSFGGLISLYTAIHYPEKVKKIAIIDSPITDKNGDTEAILEKYGNEFLEHYMKNYSISTNITPNNKQLEKSKKLFNFLLHSTSMPQDLIKDKGFSSQENMSLIKNQTLLLYGNESDCLPDGKLLKSYIPNSTLFSGTGDHNIPILNPEWINEKLSEFFI